MGFSLGAMFDELEAIKNLDISDEEKLKRTQNSIEWHKNYAIECGQLEK